MVPNLTHLTTTCMIYRLNLSCPNLTHLTIPDYDNDTIDWASHSKLTHLATVCRVYQLNRSCPNLTHLTILDCYDDIDWVYHSELTHLTLAYISSHNIDLSRLPKLIELTLCSGFKQEIHASNFPQLTIHYNS